MLLLIETAGKVCSCALSLNSKIIAYQESTVSNAHSQCLLPMIDKLFKQSGYDLSQLSAVATSKGPGSYTGLRIGTSTAKGICYALNKPLIAVDTLSILAFAARKLYYNTSLHSKSILYLPMLDARRLEVYSAIYDGDFNMVKPVSADVIEPNIYDNFLKKCDIMLVCGDGAAKCRTVFNNDKYLFAEEINLSAKDMVVFAEDKFKALQYEDVAYFEPYYLKDFVAAPSKVKGLYN